MLRRDFFRAAGAALAGLLLPLRWVKSAEPVIFDGRWHRLLIVNGKATLDGVPWAKPWLTGEFDENGLLGIRLNNFDGKPIHVVMQWVRAAKLIDGSESMFETEFRALREPDAANHRLEMMPAWKQEFSFVSYAQAEDMGTFMAEKRS